MKTYIYIILLLFTACQDAKVKNSSSLSNVIPVEKGVATVVDKLLLSKAVERIDLIALETNDASIFAGIRNLELAPQYIFINTMDRVLCFDRNGK